MHPEHHAERRADRARQFKKRLSGRPDVTYTDAFYHPSKRAMVAAPLAPLCSWYTACSIGKTETVTAAEEVAIALALACPVTKFVISDSQQAILNYDAGRISRQALDVLVSAPPPSTSRVLLWAPAHESLSGNAQVHTLARDLSCLAECRIHRAASPDASMREAVQWRKLQTGSLPHTLLYSRFFPEQIAPRYQHCSSPATLIHMVWTCTRYNTDNANTVESWESLLSASEPPDQGRLIQRAVGAAVSQGIPADLF
ncbi:hypothetical protein HPB50_022246 [Hyalomma asiaticum]|uniref:Uncharacterized protein n=1 Tax=Hyalomma asiaticum TaxID=266040 RepID=A0ACB7SAL1_HYAAI|nr:hypothetical protein HPB50_022246 [Hyalomma asiaticum]